MPREIIDLKMRHDLYSASFRITDDQGDIADPFARKRFY